MRNPMVPYSNQYQLDQCCFCFVLFFNCLFCPTVYEESHACKNPTLNNYYELSDVWIRSVNDIQLLHSSIDQ